MVGEGEGVPAQKEEVVAADLVGLQEADQEEE